ncbi:MAG: helix-turn-helix transcriptional regulator [Spirochaetes bacterium]|nr:helix-turn-helix transcriptional regulator [Spirochaetota bacterium]
MILDPFFNLYRIADRPLEEYQRYQRDTYFTPLKKDGSIAFSSSGRDVGIIPHVMTVARGVCYESPFHRHDHLELILLCGGSAVYEEESAAYPVAEGGVLFIDHTRRHRLKGTGPFSWASIRFAPQAVESVAASMTVDALVQFKVFTPFVRIEGAPVIVLEKTDARRMLVRFLEIADQFIATGGVPSEALRTSFLALMHALMSAAKITGTGPLEHVITFVREHYQQKISLAEVSGFAGMPKAALSASFTKAMGMSLPEYVNRFRIEKAKHLLSASSMPLTDIALAVGFYDAAHFTKEFEKRSGCAPSIYRKKQKPRPGK